MRPEGSNRPRLFDLFTITPLLVFLILRSRHRFLVRCFGNSLVALSTIMINFFFLLSKPSCISRAAKLTALFALLTMWTAFPGAGSADAQTTPITRQETLRGTITPEREWWDVLHYDLAVQFVPTTRSIKGSNV